ncbi:conserved hypothetical protein [Ricinus communis]|uniref:Uncharacterized protein n=1 Tax=Ricinus communis TaxID=3988 RepID=B9RTL5_RICCO|nr:conserved hypothetical protein [Ricinus communis]
MGYMKPKGGGFYFFEKDKGAMKILKFIRNMVIAVYCEGEAIVDLITENDVEDDNDAYLNENAKHTGDDEIGDVDASQISGGVEDSELHAMAEEEDIGTDSEDIDYKPIKVSDANNVLNDSDFSSDDEELLEAMRNLK